MEQIKEAYVQYAGKFNLPSYEELDKEFELLYMRSLVEIPHPLSFVRRRMNDKFSWICNMLQSILQPNPGSVVSLTEASFFSKEEKESCNTLLKSLMFFERWSLRLDVVTSEEQDAEFVQSTWKKWLEVREQVKEITQQLRDGWKKTEEKEKKQNHYMG